MAKPAVFTREDRADQDAELAFHYAQQAAAFKKHAKHNQETSRTYRKLARDFEAMVVEAAARLEVRLQLLDDQRACV